MDEETAAALAEMALPPSERTKDWSCAECGNYNYGHRKRCNRCGVDRFAPRVFFFFFFFFFWFRSFRLPVDLTSHPAFFPLPP